MRKIRLYEQVLKANTTLLVGNEEDLEKYCKFTNREAKDFESADGSILELVDLENPEYFERVIWVKKLEKNDWYDLSVLVHELAHLVRMIFVQKGIPYKAENDEMIAYYQAYFFKTFTEKYFK